MKKPLLFLPLGFFILLLNISVSAQTNYDAGRMNEVFRQTILQTGMQDPWEITHAPDGMLWFTEAKGYRVRRMTTAGASLATVLDLTTVTPTLWRKNYTGNSPQGGLMGMAFHPQWNAPSDSNFVYLAYIHDYNGLDATLPTGEVVDGQVYTTWVTKWWFNGTNLVNPVVICDTIRGSNDHNSGRMIIAPDALEGGQYFLYYAVGDMGAGQFDNLGRVNKSQWKNSYEGKILRYKLSPSAGTWIPSTNTYANSAIYARGVRNNQGFAYDPSTNKLYGSSHGPFSDDEVNSFEKGMNFGHPLVVGKKGDNNYNGSKAANPPSILPVIANETLNGDTMVGYKDPVFTAYASTQANINNIYINQPANSGWPSEGWSGLGIYTDSKIPGWNKSLLLGGLKWGRVIRLRLDATGETVQTIGGQDTISYWGGQNRFRDVAIDANGRTIYVSMDNSTTSSGPSAGNPVVPNCTGCIHKYEFLGYSDNAGASSITTIVKVSQGTNNTCETDNGVTINNATNFNSTTGLWVPITDNKSDIVAEIRGNGQNLGNVTASVYKHSGTVRKDGGGRAFLNRNVTISTQNVPGAAVKVRFYITAAELAALVATPGSQVTGIGSLAIFKSNGTCSGAVNGTITKLTGVTSASFGTDYVLTVDVTSFSTFYFASNSFTTLPTDLLDFQANLTSSRTVKVDWKTATENNVSKYIVERSLDGNTYEAIGSIDARNNGAAENLYTLTDANAASQNTLVLYYKLKVVDIDGSFKYSNIVNVSLADVAGKVYATPNPAMDETKLTINALNAGNGQWRLLDNSGRVIIQSAVQLKTGHNVIPINIRTLAAGMYYLDVKGGGIDTRVKLQKL